MTGLLLQEHVPEHWSAQELKCDALKEGKSEKAADDVELLQNSAAVKRDGYFKRGIASVTLRDINLATLPSPPP